MVPPSRRDVLRLFVLPSVITLSGCIADDADSTSPPSHTPAEETTTGSTETRTPEPNEEIGVRFWNRHDTAHEIDATMTILATGETVFDRTLSLDAEDDASFDAFTNPTEWMDLEIEAAVDGEAEISDTMDIGYGSGVSVVGVFIDATGEARAWGEYR